MYTRGLNLFFKAEINQAFQVLETIFPLSTYILAHNHFDLDILSCKRHFGVERRAVSPLHGMSNDIVRRVALGTSLYAKESQKVQQREL